MNRPGPSRRRQGGAALLIALIVLLLAAAYASAPHWHGANPGRPLASAALNDRLLRARDALIARAVTDANRPGSLPCPDLGTDDNGLGNHPNDGKADNLTRNDCPVYLGWLPWVTLDLPEPTDDSGSRLWYALARPLRDDDLAQPINSDTGALLKLDGQGDIAALIIAPGPALTGQNRPSNRPGDYLESANGDNAFVSGPATEHFNDTVLALTRRELMSAVGKRVAGEVHGCLEQHAAAPANATHDYPWPAPFASPAGRGQAGSYFGQVPDTQPGPGPQVQLAASTADLRGSQARLAATGNAAEQLAALLTLNDDAAYARALYDRLYGTAKDLALAARSNALAFADLANTLGTASSNGRISSRERKTIASAGGAAQTLFSPLPGLLGDSGIDAYPDELAIENLNLQRAIALAGSAPGAATLPALQAASAAQLSLFSRSQARQPDIGRALENALGRGASALVAAQDAAATPGDSALLNTALAAAGALYGANAQLQDSIAANRVALHASEISSRSSQLSSAIERFRLAPTAANSATVGQLLADMQSVIGGIATRSSSIGPRRAASLAALASARAACAANDAPLIEPGTRAAISQADALAGAIAQHGDNLTQESLAATLGHYQGSLATFNNAVTRTQAEMIPHAENLRLAAVDSQFWAEMIDRNASRIATQARNSPAASKSPSDPASAYSLADQLLNSLNAADGALRKVQDSIDAPANRGKQSAANAALGSTMAQLDALLASAEQLQQAVHSNAAEAFPMLWHGSRCAFLQPGSEHSSWWLANQWSATTFLQISDRRPGDAGKLTVNGAGRYRSVVLSAGQAIGAQDRANRHSASFLEGRNADPSRDATAGTPTTDFISRPAGAEFNDRLAY